MKQKLGRHESRQRDGGHDYDSSAGDRKEADYKSVLYQRIIDRCSFFFFLRKHVVQLRLVYITAGGELGVKRS